MSTLNSKNRIDRAVDAVENVSTGVKKMSNSSTKTLWHLRFAPAVLRPIGMLTSKAISLGSAILQPIRQRLNQWNWREKTALVTALTITAAGKDWLVKLFVGYAITQGLNAAFDSSILKETAVADSDTWLYRNREYLQRNYYYGDAAIANSGQNGRSVDAKAMANQLKAYDTSGTDSSLNPTTLDSDEVLDEVSDNANLTGRTDTYKILVEVGDGEWDHLYTDTNKYHTVRRYGYYAVSWGGYVKDPTDAEIQSDLDQMQEDWNNARTRRGWQRPIYMGKLKLGERTRYKREQFTCDKKIKLWSDFEHVAVPGSNDLSPTELEEPGSRSKYVTSLSYIAREAGYNHSIVTKIPPNEKPRIDYPKPKSHVTHGFMPFDLTHIPWENFQIIGDLTWIGSAKRYYKSKSRKRWCKFCERSHRRALRGIGPIPSPCTPGFSNTTRYEYKIFQNESVKKPSN